MSTLISVPVVGRQAPARPRLEIGTRPAGLALLAHLGALVFGLVGILVMIPNPQLWSDDPRAVEVFDFSIRYAGSVHIVLGAVVMLLFGVATVGPAKTAIFFVVSCGLSLTSELLGTSTGWPFGNYAYTDFLGWKVLDHVPYSIPLSWFYLGFASYLIARAIVARLGVRRQTLWTLVGGFWLMTAWDLVLDPAMAHESLTIKFWLWDEAGAYFGMPIKNFVGWALTGLVYMAVSRAIWREEVDPRSFSAGLPVGVYVANMVFAMALSASVDLWIPILLALVVGVLPALYALGGVDADPGRAPRQGLRRAPAPPRLVAPASISRG